MYLHENALQLNHTHTKASDDGRRTGLSSHADKY